MMRGYEGLDTLKRAHFLRPVQIVRQTISNLDTQICRIRPYHRFEGLSIGRKKRRNKERHTISLLAYINLILGLALYADMKV